MVNKPLIRPYFWGGYVRGGRLTSHEEIRQAPPGMVLKPVVNNGIHYQGQLVSRSFSINSMVGSQIGRIIAPRIDLGLKINVCVCACI